MSWIEGGCHCGRVRFRVRVTKREALDCNCSICTKKGFLHAIVTRDDFELLSGRDALTTYTFGTRVAQHTFCATCGMHPFYVPRSHPDGFDVNVRCLDEGLEAWTILPFDGRNWETSITTIRDRDSGDA